MGAIECSILAHNRSVAQANFCPFFDVQVGVHIGVHVGVHIRLHIGVLIALSILPLTSLNRTQI